MASNSTAISLSLATTSLTSHQGTTSIATLKPHERTLLPSSSLLGSSLLGTSISLEKSSPRTRPITTRKGRHSGTCMASSSPLPSALLFDCDGVLVDTEKDGHRISFNDTFNERELGVTWDVDLYGELLKVGGGKERLIDQASAGGVKVAVCSTSNGKAQVFLLGPERAEKIKIFAGDVVRRKKPDPAIYIFAANNLGVDPSSCAVIEDSAIGLAAAKAAGMTCIVSKSGYTADEGFSNADAVFDCIGDPPEERFDWHFAEAFLRSSM